VEVWWLLGAEATGVAQRLRRSRLMVARRCIVDWGRGARKKVMREGSGRKSGCYIPLHALFVDVESDESYKRYARHHVGSMDTIVTPI